MQEQPDPALTQVDFKFDHGTGSKPDQAPDSTKSKPAAVTKKDPSQEEDLIKVVLTAVEDNWLKQAPHPTLDKTKALQVEKDESGDHSECESRDTSEADYLKVKENAAKSATSDDEGTHLCRQGMLIIDNFRILITLNI